MSLLWEYFVFPCTALACFVGLCAVCVTLHHSFLAWLYRKNQQYNPRNRFGFMSVGIWILTSHICDLRNRFFNHSYCSVICHSMWRTCEIKLTWNLTYAYDSKINRCREFTFVKWTTFVLTLTCHCCWFLRYRAQLTDWLNDWQTLS